MNTKIMTIRFFSLVLVPYLVATDMIATERHTKNASVSYSANRSTLSGKPSQLAIKRSVERVKRREEREKRAKNTVYFFLKSSALKTKRSMRRIEKQKERAKYPAIDAPVHSFNLVKSFVDGLQDFIKEPTQELKEVFYVVRQPAVYLYRRCVGSQRQA